jgi:hypothetical protein
LFREFDGKRFAKRMPKMLETKLEFMGKCVSNTAELSQFQQQCDSLIDKFTRLSTTRHKLVHGAITSTSPNEDGFEFLKLDAGSDMHFASNFTLKPSEFPRLTRDLLALGADSLNLATQIFDIVKKRP